MTDRFKNNFEYFITEQEVETLQNFRVESSEYDFLRKLQTEDSQECDIIIQNLSEKDQDFLHLYIDRNNQITGMEFDSLYIQGYKDCVKLLSYIGVL